MSKAILLEEQFRQALILWGREVSLLRKRIIEVSENYTNDVQLVLNELARRQGLSGLVEKANRQH